jgi:AcrR family transcriptional regulator
MSVRMRRSEMVMRNRESVLAAARRVFLARGYTAATLEEIAEEAGFSKGVMYSQFESKADLFLSLLERRIEERAQQNERIAAKLSGAEGVRQLIETFSTDAAAEVGWALVLIEFRALVARDPQLSRRYAAAHSRAIDGVASVLNQLITQAGLEPAYPARVMAEFALGLGPAIVLERAANAGALPTALVAEMVAGGLGLRGSPAALSRRSE